ncbi:MAG: FKBP-type peptidyl-prolyl cis-trans isomerase [Flavobacteriales bacterium]|nr:FKBP-type peptidyl-prolyl cis-trans isomerase [Flavobacteriales bacterium]
MIKILILVAFTNMLFLFSCTEPEKKVLEQKDPTAEIKNQFVEANKRLLQKENDDIDYYIKSHNMPFVRTTSGIRYFVYNAAEKGDSIKEEMEITMSFKVFLLNGDEVYNSEKDGKKTFIVGYENLESGLHTGVQFLKKGDKALIIIPSHLAHGLLGDLKKIPPQMPIIYDVQIDS